MAHIKTYSQYSKITESYSYCTVPLYHGTTDFYAKKLVQDGWSPRRYSISMNGGESHYLYLTTNINDALSFGDWVLELRNVPMDDLSIDYYRSTKTDGMQSIFNKYDNLDIAIAALRSGVEEGPYHVVLKKSLDAKNFRIVKKGRVGQTILDKQ